MTRIRNEEPIPAEYVESLLRGSAPERLEDIKALWKKYEPQFFVAEDGPDPGEITRKYLQSKDLGKNAATGVRGAQQI